MGQSTTTNVIALIATLVLGAAAWALTRGATPYYALDLIGGVLLWALLMVVAQAFVTSLAKALRG